MTAHRILALGLCALSCSQCAAPSRGGAAAEPPSSVASLAWMVGRWVDGEGGVEQWQLAEGGLFGVAFPAAGPAFEVMIVAPKAAQVSLTAWPNGFGGVVFPEIEREPSSVRFTLPEHDPASIVYSRDGDALRARVEGGDADAELEWRKTAAPSAPELEAADRSFAADTRAQGSAGWASWFDPEGAQWRPGHGRVEGPAAIREHVRPAFDDKGIDLAWTPRFSGLAPGEELGFTVGDYVMTPPEGEPRTGSYVSIWRRQPDGTWRVLFDVGT